ncbi:MAG: HAD family phosphatase [Caldilineaceae bacterium]
MKAVILDLGRVLVHYDHQKTIATTANLWKLTPDHLQPLMQEVSVALGTGAMDAETFHALLCTRLGQTVPFADFIAAYAAGIQRDEEALAYALALQQRPDTTVAIMSNTNAAHVLWLDEHLPELREFDLVMMSNEVGVLKPDPAIVELALELLDVPPAQAIFIDDIAENVEAARALGMAGLVHSDWSVTRPALEQWLEST